MTYVFIERVSGYWWLDQASREALNIRGNRSLSVLLNELFERGYRVVHLGSSEVIMQKFFTILDDYWRMHPDVPKV